MDRKKYRLNKAKFAEVIAGVILLAAAGCAGVWMLTHMYW